MLKCSNILIRFCLQEELTHFGLRSLTNFVLKVLKHFGLKRLHKKNRQNSQIFLNHTKSSYVLKCFNTCKSYTVYRHFFCHLASTLPTVYYFPILYQFLSVKVDSIPFSHLLACNNRTILDLVRCHARDINSLLKLFLNAFC